ncbi:MAG: hypothetical protein J0I40_00475 [Cellulomonas sp.]|nr:hypothetical protein [Cellulomonas sp.]
MWAALGDAVGVGLGITLLVGAALALAVVPDVAIDVPAASDAKLGAQPASARPAAEMAMTTRDRLTRRTMRGW